MKPDEFMKKHGFDDDDQEERDHSLQENALEHAHHLKRPNAGTPYDWEEWEQFRKEHPDQVEPEEKPDR